MNKKTDLVGPFCGLPYDFRTPTLPKIAKRLYQPGGPLFVPKVFGAGWTLNFAHPGTKWVLGVSMLAMLIAVTFG
jgi:hypothetical protein